MKIVFTTIYDPKDISRGSGTYFFMSREMEQLGHDVYYIGPVLVEDPTVTRGLRGIHYRIGKRYKRFLDPFIARLRGSKVSQVLRSFDFDVLITNDFGIAGYTNTERPIVLYTDAMIPFTYRPNEIPSQSRISNLSSFGVFLFKKTIRRGVRRADLCVFPERWIAEEAVKYSAKIEAEVIPFGANIEDPGGQIAIKRNFTQVISKKRIDLLFVGKDWKRKGGNVALRTVNELRKRGINALLHVVGEEPEHMMSMNNALKYYGFLDKRDKEDYQRLKRLYQECDAFILPSVSEGSVIVVAEAAAYGLPVLAYDVPGVSERVIQGKGGLLLKINASEGDFADAIENWFIDPSLYGSLVRGARHNYETQFNWTKSIDLLFKAIHNHIAL